MNTMAATKSHSDPFKKTKLQLLGFWGYCLVVKRDRALAKLAMVRDESGDVLVVLERHRPAAQMFASDGRMRCPAPIVSYSETRRKSTVRYSSNHHPHKLTDTFLSSLANKVLGVHKVFENIRENTF